MTGSLFPGKASPNAQEIKFRALFALGWAVERNLALLEAMTKYSGQGWRFTNWIDLLEAEVLEKLHANSEDADAWPGALDDRLDAVSKQLNIKKRERSNEFLNGLRADIKNPIALDPQSQIDNLALQSHWQKFDCSYLNREQTLHAYGPLAQDIQEIPGAPPARVAACLGYWGITLEPDSLMRITQPLVKDQTLIVVQNRLLKNSQELSRQLIEVLPEATEVAVKIP